MSVCHPTQVPGGQLAPDSTYVVSIFNNNYVVDTPFIYSLAFYVMAESGSTLHPYMSILLGVTAAVILCLAMTLCKRVVVRYGFVPWRWQQRQQQLAAAGGAGGQNSLALVLMAQSQPASRGVPPEIYQAFPCRCVCVCLGVVVCVFWRQGGCFRGVGCVCCERGDEGTLWGVWRKGTGRLQSSGRFLGWAWGGVFGVGAGSSSRGSMCLFAGRVWLWG